MSLTTHIQLNNDARDMLMRAPLMTSSVLFTDAGCTGPSGNFSGAEYSQYNIEGTYLDDPSSAEGLSITCRVLPRNISGGYVISTGGQTQYGIGVSISFHLGEFNIYLKTNTRQWSIRRPCPAANEVYHIALTWDSSILTLYVDGVSVASTNGADVNTLSNPHRTLTIGKPNNVNSHYFDGLIEDVRFFSHVISLNEIVSSYRSKLLDVDFTSDTTNENVKDIGRFQDRYVLPPVTRPPDAGDRGLTFSDHVVELTNRRATGSFTLSARCNLDINNQIIQDQISGGDSNYYATLLNIPNVLTIFVHNHNDIRIETPMALHWRANSTTLYNSSPFTWGVEALVTVTYDHVNNVLTTYHNGQRVWDKTVVLPSQYSSKLSVGKVTSGNLGGTSHRPFVGNISKVQQYGICLTPDEVRELAIKRMSIDTRGAVVAHNKVIERTEFLPGIDKINLVDNGKGERGSNINFSAFQFVKNLSGDPYFQRESGSIVTNLNDFIPVHGNGLDTFESYRIACDIKGGDIPSRYYFMILCYDRNMRRIEHQDIAMESGTDTVLTQPLNYGDIYAYVDDISYWFSVTNSSQSVYNNFCYWMNDPDPYVVYKYTRRRHVYTDTDVPNKRIRFINGWPGPNLPAGTPVMNSRNGSTYSYIGAVNLLTDVNNWVHREGQSSRSPNRGSMRYGSSYIRVGWLLNRNVSRSITQIKNVQCWNVDSNQKMTFKQRGELVSRLGHLSLSTISESEDKTTLSTSGGTFRSSISEVSR